MIAAAMPKSAVSSRMNFNRNGDVRTASAQRPKCNVRTPRMSEKKACAKSCSSSLKYLTNAPRPALMKIADTNSPKISCVNRVQLRSISTHASVSAMMTMNSDAHIPVHAYVVAKGAS